MKPTHILLVEDDDIDREAVVRYARKKDLPYKLKTAATEREAFYFFDDMNPNQWIAHKATFARSL